MTAPSLLSMQRVGATPTGQRLTGGTSLATVSGGTFGAVEGGTTYSNVSNVNVNRCIEFKGELYAYQDQVGAKVYRRSGGSWSLVHTGSTPFGILNSGLFVVNSGGTEYLCCLYITAPGPNQIRIARSSDGTSWTDVLLAAGAVSFSSMGGIAVFRGQLAVSLVASTSQSILLADVAGLSGSFISIPEDVSNSGNQSAGCFCVFRNRLYVLKTGFNSRAAILYQVAGGGVISRSSELYTVQAIANSAGSAQQPVLFPVGSTKMVGILITANEIGGSTFNSIAYDFVPSGLSFTITNKTNPFIPLTLRTPAAGLRITGWFRFVDNDTDPANPAVYLWYANGPANTHVMSYFEYVDSDSEMAPGTAGPNVYNFPLSFSSRGGGEFVDTTDSDLFVDSVALTPSTTPGWVQISFRARGAVGPADKFVRGWFSTFETANMTQMTLVGTATGGSAVRNGNQIEQVEANPANLYTMQWDASGQGIQSGQPCSIMLRLGTT